MDELLTRLPATIELVALALVVAALIGVALGTLGSYLRRSHYDRASRLLVTLLQSVPEFLLALLLIFVCFYLLRIAPAPVGQLDLAAGEIPRVSGFLLVDTLAAGRPDQFVGYLQHLALPVAALGITYAAFFSKITRSVTSAAFGSAQVEFARACGLPERQVIRYALLQSRSPIITYGAILFGSLVGGAAIVERIFSWQGAGQWALDAILRLDLPAIQGFVLVSGTITILVYLLLDVLVLLLDPRVRQP